MQEKNPQSASITVLTINGAMGHRPPTRFTVLTAKEVIICPIDML